jgi:hypothetical protein
VLEKVKKKKKNFQTKVFHYISENGLKFAA